MKNYVSIKLENCDYDYLIIATTHMNPVNQFLNNNSVSFMETGKVVFDLTVINGNKYNRFVFADIMNHKITTQSITVSDTANDIIINTSKNYFSKHLDLIERSILPQALKYILINEYTRN